MGYACPVCDDPQADAGHLANHLAFTAITSGGDHETWLDDRVPDWGQRGESDLAEAVVEYAEETEYPTAFDPDEAATRAAERDGATSGRDGPTRGRGGTTTPGPDLGAARERGRGDLDEAAREAIEAAREMTRERLSGSDGQAGDEDRQTEDGDRRTEDGDRPGSETE